jgi:DUF1680 family protein
MSRWCWVVLLLAIPVFLFAQVDALARSVEGKVKVRPVVELKARPFALDRVRLLDGPFKTAQDSDHAYLLTLDPYRLLNGFYVNAGLEPRGEAYGGWERMDIAGHSLGHYLTAASQMYAATGDEKLKAKAETIVSELKKCQRPDGMLAGFPEAARVWSELAKAEVRSQPFNLNGIWVPWYNQHKLLDGLQAAYLYCDSTDALAIASKVCDHAALVTSALTPELWQRMLATEHGGMNEVLANQYAYTGEKKYLELSEKFYHNRVLDPLVAGERRLTGLHGNTQVPKLIGTARLFELTGEQRFRSSSLNFWKEVVEDHTYVSGGNTMGEYFGPPKQLSARIGSNTTETCNTFNMLKLTQHLYCVSPSVELGDYYERALWNHILASVNPERYGVTYFLPLGMGVRKQFSGPLDNFTCCHGSGMENHSKYGGSVFYEDRDVLYIDQFVSSELDWKEMGVKVELSSGMPLGAETTVTVRTADPTRFTVKIRVPRWAQAVDGPAVTYSVSRGGDVEAASGEYITVSREWRDGDTLTLRFRDVFREVAMPDDPKRLAFMYGPVVLVAVWDQRTSEFGLPPVRVRGGRGEGKWIELGDRELLDTRTTLRPYDLKFVPLYTVHDEKYSVFLDDLTEEEWAARVSAHRKEQERLRELESRTLEFVDVGSQRSTRNNNLKSGNSFTGTLNERRWRDARDGGFFEFDIRVDPNGPNQLMLTYWGSDGGNRVFDIFVDGNVVATQRLTAEKQGEFFDVVHDLPLDMTRAREKVVVRIQAKPGAMAGGVFGVRTLRPKD